MQLVVPRRDVIEVLPLTDPLEVRPQMDMIYIYKTIYRLKTDWG